MLAQVRNTIGSCVAVLAALLLLAGCASNGKVPDAVTDANGGSYPIPEKTALIAVQRTLREVFPGSDINTLKGEYPGFFVVVQRSAATDARYARFMQDTLTYAVEVIPAQGREEGYFYRLKGSGASSSEEIGSMLRDRLKESFGAASRKVSTRVGSTKKPARSERETHPGTQGNDVFTTLRKLKQLYDEGVISEQEYLDTKRKLLGRL